MRAEQKITVSSQRMKIMFRSFTATLGGYGLSALSGAWLARFLPLSRDEATVTGLMVSCLIFVVIFIWVFAARNMLTVWLVMSMIALVSGGTLWWSIETGGQL